MIKLQGACFQWGCLILVHWENILQFVPYVDIYDLLARETLLEFMLNLASVTESQYTRTSILTAFPVMFKVIHMFKVMHTTAELRKLLIKSN